MSLSNNIKYLREKNGLTQMDIAIIAGVTDKAVSTWENGTYQPRMGAIEKLCEFFNVPKSALLDDDLELNVGRTKKLALQEDEFDDKTKLLIELFTELDDKRKDEMLRHARLLELEQNQ